jgi:hypothetical protein
MNRLNKYSLLFFSMLLQSCAVRSQTTHEIVTIQFTSIARGGYSKEVIITRDSLQQYITERRGEDRKAINTAIDKKDWALLVASTNTLAIQEVPELVSPTQKRAFDGARHSSLTITMSNRSVYSHSFDDELPHEKLQPLMNEVLRLISNN